MGICPDWKRYRDMRAKTSHSDDEGIASEVVAGILPFLAEAHYLLAQLKAKRA